MQLQVPNPAFIFKAFPATLRGGAIDSSRDGPPPAVLADFAPGQHSDQGLTASENPRVYNKASGQRPAASGQRPAASGQRPAASGMTCARRQAGARTPAPSTSAGPRRPDARTGRARARRLSLLLPVVALLLGALGLFAPAPAEAQTVTLVTNFGQTKLTGTRFTGDNSLAQGFTTGSNSGGYTLTSIEAISRGGGTAVQAATVRAELWSATTGGAPDSKIADLTIPTGAVAANTTMSFGAPAGTTLTASTTYYFMIYTVGAFNLALESTSAHAEDSGGLSGWTIANAIRFQRNDSPSGSTWSTDSQGAIALIRVKGAAKQDTANANLSALTAATHTSSTGTFTSLTLTPSTFSATTTSYTATVGNARTHLKLTPTVAATGATVKVGKGTSLTTVTSGSASAAIPLSVGSNAITVEVTAADGTTKKTYTVTVTRVPTGTVWQAILTPQDLGAGFGLGCTITFPSGANRCDVETTLTGDDFSVGSNSHTIDGIQFSGGTLVLTFSVASAATYQSSLSSLNFCVGSTALAFSNSSASGGVNVRQWTSTGLTWTAGTPVSLSIGTSCPQQTTTPTQSSDATLSGLTLTQATSASGPFSALSIGNFAAGTATYAASVANSITHVKLRPTVNDSNASVKVGKGTSLTTVASGSPSAAIALDVGANALKVEVTAEDGTKQTYTVTVTRAQAQTQAPAPVVPTGPGKTVWSATLTAQNVVPTVVVGCTGSGSSSCALTSVLTDDDFSLFGKTFTITQIQQTSAGALDIGFDQAISTQTARRLTLHVGDREFPLTEAAYSSGNTTATWASTGLTWSASQQVPMRLTLGPRWSGVAFEGGGLLPGPTGGQELLVAEDGSATFGVKLTQAPTANVTIRLYKFAPAAIHGNANAVTFSPKELTFTPGNYGTAQTVTVTGVPDGNAAHEHLYIMAASSSADANYALQDGHEALFVTVTDGAGAVKVGLSRGAARESGDGTATNAPVTVWLNRASTSQVRVTYATAPDPDAPSNKRAAAGSDYTHVSGTLVFQPGQTRKTVQVPILDDNVEDSGESFRFVLSTLVGASHEEGYGHVTMVILNDEAQIDGLSVEGAPGAGGPWAKLDIGTFAPETADYAVTVPHDTTHARVTPETGDEDLLLWAGSGTGLASVRSGQAGSTVALAVGENVLLVQTRAATGKRQTYRVTVTREAQAAVAVTLSAAPNPVVEGSPVTVTATLAKALDEAVTVPLTLTRGTSEDGDHGSLASIAIPAGFTSAAGTVPTVEDGDGDDETFTVALGSLPSGLVAGAASSVRVTIADSALTARLRGTVAEHDGETPFMVELVLGESLDSGSRMPSAASFAVKGGSVESVRRFRPYRFHVHIKPKSRHDVTVTLAGGRACDEAGAICTADGRSVSNTSTLAVAGPDGALSSDADLSGLSVEAKTEDGWTALGIGTFATATTAYSATVPHGTTHARLTAAAADANATLKAGAGSSLTAVADGTASGAIALSVGANALKVEVTAEDGTIRTYAVAVTRQAAPLTAAFENVPSEHDGTAFAFDLTLSDTPGAGNLPVAASFKVGPGTASVSGSGTRYTVTVTPKAANAWKDVTITLAGGRACDEEGAVCTADGRALSNTLSATVGGPVRIRVAGARAKEGKDATLDFAVTLNRAASHEVSVDYATKDETATAGLDYTATSGTLVFAAGETAKTVSVPVLDDSVDEGKEIMRLKLSNPKGAYLRGVHTKARGIITNNDPLPGAWLSRFGRTVAGHHVAAIRDRLAAGSGPGLSARFAGQPLPTQMRDGDAQAADVDGMKKPSPETRVARDASTAGAVLSSRTAPRDAGALSENPDEDETLAFRSLRAFLAGDGDEGEASVHAVAADDVLLGTEFVMTRDAGSGLSHGFWGRAARSGFSGREGETSVEGTVTGVLLGTDWKRKGMAFGVIVSESRGSMTYGGGASSGAIDARLSAFVPWAGLEIGKHSSLWGAAGIGRGDMTLRPDGQDPTVTGIGWSMAALGAEGALAPGARIGGASLGWHADALATRAESDAARTETGNLAAGSGRTTRMRLGLRAAWQRTLASGATLSPRIEAGVRHDGGDAETGLGIEVGGGIAFVDPARGLSMSMDARTLAMHEDGNFRDWGLSLGLSWDPRPETKRGCSATAQHGLGGASAGGVDALFGPEAFPGAPGAEGGSGWSVEAACGTGRGRGMVGSPYARASGGGEAESLRVGYRIEPDADHAEDATVQAWADPSADGGTVGAGLEWRW